MKLFNKEEEKNLSSNVADTNWSEIENYLEDTTTVIDKGQKRSNIIKMILKVLLLMVLNSSCLWLISAMLGYFSIPLFVIYCLIYTIPIIVYCYNYDYNEYQKAIN